jgi:hypothetical protein
VRTLVAQGKTGAQALAQHPLPPGTSTADALAFLATLPQTTYQIGNVNSGVVTGPPVITEIGAENFDPATTDVTAFDGFEFDPFFPEGGNMESIDSNPKILRGAAFVSEVRKSCAAHGIDALASFANAMAEGIGGGIGDSGEAFGPWQTHLEDGRMAQFDNQDLYSPIVQAWAWTANGIDYVTRSMVAGGAKNKKGHEAVYDIVYGFERPADKAGAYKIRANNYDVLKNKGSGADAYLAQLAHGPSLTPDVPGTTGRVPTPTTTKPVSPTPTKQSFSDLMSFLAKDAPFAANHTKTLSGDLVAIFK